MLVKSFAFEDGGMIPSKHTCDGTNVSPPLSWSDGPEETKSYAIICDDPDAPAWTWVHWVIYNIPIEKTELAENIAATRELSDGSVQGVNDFGALGYSGPCPPVGIHRYFFKIYALSEVLAKRGIETKMDLQRAMKGLVLDEGQLMGRYTRG